MEVLVLYYGCDDQDVLQQGDDPQDQKDLRRAEYSVTEKSEKEEQNRWVVENVWLRNTGIVSPPKVNKINLRDDGVVDKIEKRKKTYYYTKFCKHF